MSHSSFEEDSCAGSLEMSLGGWRMIQQQQEGLPGWPTIAARCAYSCSAAWVQIPALPWASAVPLQASGSSSVKRRSWQNPLTPQGQRVRTHRAVPETW